MKGIVHCMETVILKHSLVNNVWIPRKPSLGILGEVCCFCPILGNRAPLPCGKFISCELHGNALISSSHKSENIIVLLPGHISWCKGEHMTLLGSIRTFSRFFCQSYGERLLIFARLWA